VPSSTQILANNALSVAGIEWAVSGARVDYAKATAVMEERVLAIAEGRAPELVWLLEHPPLYTAGTSAKSSDLLNAGAFPVYQTGRGGQFTYHGPGQRVAYVMLDVQKRFGGDVRAFTAALEHWLIDALALLGVTGITIPGRTGVWVAAPESATSDERHAKIAAIGLRIRRGISFHGVALNVDPKLEHYRGIVPCGLADSAVTSLAALGKPATMRDASAALRTAFAAKFANAPRDGDPPVV
jgi:lipoyl(octanoyl) transferase